MLPLVRGVDLEGLLGPRRGAFDRIVEVVVKAKVVAQLSPDHELLKVVVHALVGRRVVLLETNGLDGASLRGELPEVEVRGQVAQSRRLVRVVPELVILVHPHLGQEAVVLPLERSQCRLLSRLAPRHLRHVGLPLLPRQGHQIVPCHRVRFPKASLGVGKVKVLLAGLRDRPQVLGDVSVNLAPDRPCGVLLLVARDPDGDDVVRVHFVKGDLDGARHAVPPLPRFPQGGEVRDEGRGIPGSYHVGHHRGRLPQHQVERDVQRGQMLLHLLESLDHEQGVAMAEPQLALGEDEQDHDRLTLGLRNVQGVEQGPVVPSPLVPVAEVHDRSAGFVILGAGDIELAPARFVNLPRWLALG
mmetsp:Transcript_34063/g.73771  ORF Transcript_34063/g.73771 Transcript_34063/m.73771 type:complete len:358 (-) Transcript_34063:298-1371(-)